MRTSPEEKSTPTSNREKYVMRKIGSEENIVYKRRYSYHVALVFPSTYQASLSSLGLQVLYYALNSYREVYAERIVYEEGVPKSIETGTPLNKFDLVLATTSYELDYPVLYRMLMSSERKNPVIVGGPSPTANPTALKGMVDAVYRGEIEDNIPRIVDALSHIEDKKMFIEELADIPGMWIPEIAEDAEIQRVHNLDNAFHPITQIQNRSVESVFGRSLMVEPSRGCDRGCRFCLEGRLSRPRRERSLSLLKKIITVGTEANGVNRVSFYTLSFYDSTQGERLLEYLVENRLRGSIPSVRADSLNEYRVSLLKDIGQKTLAIAPETPVKRLQLFLGKSIGKDTVLNTARWCKKYGLSLKLYYIVGLPGEGEEELEKIAEQVKSVWNIMKDRNRVKVSVNPFIPKPLTPLWRVSMQNPSLVEKKIRFLREKLKMISRFSSYPPKKAFIQYRINWLGDKAFQLIKQLAERLSVHRASISLEET